MHTILIKIKLPFFLLTALFLGITDAAYGQAAINTDGSQPDASAMLEIKSNAKGLLIPRLTTSQRTAIASPATGLLVFDSDLGSFYYYSAGGWVNLVNSTQNIDTDNQTIDVLSLSGTTLSISLQDDAEATKTVSLATLKDNLGTHIATQNIQTGGNWLSNDGGSEGVFVSTTGNVGIGTNTPNSLLEMRKDLAGSINQFIITNRGATSSGTGSALVFRGYRDTDQNYEVGKIEMQHKAGFHGDLTHAADMIFYTRGNVFGTSVPTEQMRITSAGLVGFGTTTPTQAKVVINGSANTTIAGFGYLSSSGTGTQSGSFSNSFSLYASNYIAAAEFNATSDIRIKNIIGLSDAAKDLTTLMSIRITDYQFRDTISKGTELKKKVIAQQVKEVYPQAVTQNTDVVPDIYKKSVIKNGKILLKTDLQPGELVQLITEKDKQVFKVLEVSEDGFTADYKGADGAVFVYGRQVDNFLNVDYEAIAMLNVSATQEMYRMLEKQQTIIDQQQQKLAKLEEQLQKVDKLEALILQLQEQNNSSISATLPIINK